MSQMSAGKFSAIMEVMKASLKRHPFVLIPFLFYYYTASREMGLGDVALLVGDIQQCIITTSVNNHNVTILLGWLFSFLPFGPLEFRATLVSVLLGGLCIALFYLLVSRIFRSRMTAACAATALMVSHSMWWHSAIIECYAANALFMVAGLLWITLYRESDHDERYLYALIVTSGLALFQHAQLGVLGLGAIVLTLGHMRVLWSRENCARAYDRFIARVIAAGVIGLLPYGLTLLHDASVVGGVSQAWANASGGQFRSIMFRGNFWISLREVGVLILQQFPTPYLLLLPAGLVLFLRQWRMCASALAILTMFCVNTLFFMYFNTWDRFAFLLISFIVLAFWSTFALDRLIAWARRAQSETLMGLLVIMFLFCVGFPPYLYAHLAVWGREPGFWHARFNNGYSINSHDVAGYIANPNKRHYRDVRQYCDLLFAALPPHAIYLDNDARVYYPVEFYRKHYGRRSDLHTVLLNSWGFDNWGFSQQQFNDLLEYAYCTDKKLFLVSTDRPFSEFLARAPRRYEFKKFQLSESRWIYRLVTMAAAGGDREQPVVMAGAAAAGTMAVSASHVPVVKRIAVGMGFNTRAPIERATFSGDEAIMAQLSFEKNAIAFPIYFRWIAPSGKIYFESSFGPVPPGNTDCWSFLHKSSSLEEGLWRVEACTDDKVVGQAGFAVSRR